MPSLAGDEQRTGGDFRHAQRGWGAHAGQKDCPVLTISGQPLINCVMADVPKIAAKKQAPPDAPRWVKVFGLVFAVLVALFIALHLGGHGLGNHMHGH